MSKGKILETIYGRYSKYEIFRRATFMGYEFYIYKDGEYWTGTFPSLKAAVQYVKAKG